MREIFEMSKRHIKNYYRDKAAVFFSFLSIIIMLVIYIFFLGKMYADIPFPNELMKNRFLIGYIMGGVLVVNTLTLSLGIIGTYVNDVYTGKINGMLVTPVKRYKITISYFLSTFLLTLGLTIIMFLLIFLYFGIAGYWVPFVDILKIIGVIAICVMISTPLILLLATFISSTNAFGGISAIVGTLIGFVCGIYVPLNILGDAVKSIATLLPFSHMTIHMRRLLIGGDIINTLAQQPANPANPAGPTILEANSLDYLKIFGAEINIYLLLGIFVIISMGFLFFAYLRMTKKTKGGK